MIIAVRQFFNKFKLSFFSVQLQYNNNGNDWFTPEKRIEEKEITLAVNEMRFFHKMIRAALLLAKLPLKHSTKAVKKHFVVMHGG